MGSHHSRDTQPSEFGEKYETSPTPDNPSSLHTQAKYNDAINVVYNFWQKYVDSLDRDNQIMLGMVHYSYVFRGLPEARRLFRNHSIEDQAKLFLDMFGWLVRRLHSPEKSSFTHSLNRLGEQHLRWGVRPEWFPIMLEGWHEALTEQFPEEYTLRVRFCLERVFMFVANTMTGQTLESTVMDGGRGEEIERFLVSLPTCLRHSIGRRYLEKYMDDKFCSEIYMFHADYLKYKAASSPIQRSRLGKFIRRRYIEFGSECEINLSYDDRVDILDQCEEIGFSPTLFDDAEKVCLRMVRENVWVPFKKVLCDMVGISNKDLERRIASLSSTDLLRENSLSLSGSGKNDRRLLTAAHSAPLRMSPRLSPRPLNRSTLSN